MARGYRYVDAVRLLNGDEPAIQDLDTVLGVATLGLWDLIDVKGQLVQVGKDLLARWREWRSRSSWRSRTERIEAAHTIVVVTAFFSALDELRLDIRLTPEEQERLAGVPLGRPPLESVPFCPSPQQPFEATRDLVASYYRDLALQLFRFIGGFAFWEDMPEHRRERISDAVLAQQALRLYEDSYRRLAQDVPEFGFWAGMIDHQATRASLTDLHGLLSRVAAEMVPGDRLAELTRAQQALLRRAIADIGEVPDGLVLPSLEEAYITPCYRITDVGRGDNPAIESWWDEHRLRRDLPAFLAGFLTNPMASRVPLVVLGQPGAGKSVLTKVLAARLPATQYLPIRVPLREVSANSGIQEQIEQAVHQLTSEQLSWPTIAKSANGALPVVMLDGFDELIQATGVRQSDYLAKVVKFQEREADLGRAVSVIVTSRTAVVNRAEFPVGTVVARLEPFDQKQIEAWLAIWNRANADHFRTARIQPLGAEEVLSQRQLAEQPLLLLMLAIYDADGNALGKGFELSQAELYERLLRRFAERELLKEHPPARARELVDWELTRLSLVAFSMFNRRRPWATSDEVDRDLEALLEPAPLAQPKDFATPLGHGDRAFGRFFFVHRAQAVRDDRVLETYEFLHLTFEEFLIARMVVTVVAELAIQESARFRPRAADGLLRTLLSYSVLTNSTAIITFMREVMASHSVEERKNWQSVLARISRELDQRDDSHLPGYRPWDAGSVRRHAYYSANLMIIALICRPSLNARELLSDEGEGMAGAWRRRALLWRSQVALAEWYGLVSLVTISDYLGLSIEDLASRERSMLSSSEAFTYDRGAPSSELLREQARFSYLGDEIKLLHAVEPILPMGPPELLRDYLDILMLPLNVPVRDRSQAYVRIGYRTEQQWEMKAILGDLAMMPVQAAGAVLKELATVSDAAEQYAIELATRLGLPQRIGWYARG
ncbi:hypothetical protein [Nonomuraea sp. NPDC050310]|uniref:NACHT domain-containing protein n=1 Tax=Nonomuraea sp. NPDC050310 TaxID=3154935 RepID=UPI0033F20092